jgi:hypothetical protein
MHLHVVDAKPGIANAKNGTAVAHSNIMHTELARFPHVSVVPERVSFPPSQTPARTAQVSSSQHLRWNRLLGLTVLLGLSAGGWTLVGLVVARLLK